MKIRTPILMAGLLALPVSISMPTEARADYCREYTKSIIIAGKKVESYGTACMQPDGAWKMMDEEMQTRHRSRVKYIKPANDIVVVRKPVYISYTNWWPYQFKARDKRRYSHAPHKHHRRPRH